MVQDASDPLFVVQDVSDPLFVVQDATDQLLAGGDFVMARAVHDDNIKNQTVKPSAAESQAAV